MRAGTIIGGRWTVAEELPTQGELRRWWVSDGAVHGEAVSPAGHVLMRPGTRDAFVNTGAADHPAALPTWDVAMVDGVPVRVRPQTARTLEGLRLTPEQAITVAGSVGAAVLASGGAAFGELGPEDIVVDAGGTVRFAPTGVPRAESLARPPHTRAPEGSRTAEADLYGLGATLHFALSGAWPTAGVPVRVAPGVDHIVSALLAQDPEARRLCVETLGSDPLVLEEGSAPAVPSQASRASSGAAIVVTTTTQPQRSVEASTTPLPPWVVQVPLAGLSRTALATLAARSSATFDAIERAAARGETWAVDGATTEAEAGRILARLEAAGIKGRLVTTSAPKVIQYVLLATLSAVVGGIAGIWGGPTVWLAFGALAMIMLYFAAVNLYSMVSVASTRMLVAERERAALPADAPESRLRAVRQRIAAAELPEIVLSDMRAEVGTIERHIDDLRGHQAELRGAAAPDLAERREQVAAELRKVEALIAALDAALTRALTSELEGPRPGQGQSA